MKVLGDVGAGHVLGRYELLLPIASGGMAMVWAARLRGTRGFQKIVAVKTMLPAMTDDPQFEQMFLDEASLASRIRHPQVVETLDLGEQDGVLYLVMEWIDGEPLQVLLKATSKGDGLPLPLAIRMAAKACGGLHAAHELKDDVGGPLGLVHRDVSPQNILVGYDGIVKIVDFGVAKAAGRAAAATMAGQIKGKVPYMSPEQASGGAIDRRTDVFAMGVLLYMMTTGKHPFRGDSEPQTLLNICSEEPAISPASFTPNYPPALEGVVMRALAKNKDERFATAADLMHALEEAVPAALRVTDDEVATFMKSLLADRLARRKEAIKDAMRVADDRTAAQAASRGPGSLAARIVAENDNPTPPSGISALQSLPGAGMQSAGVTAVTVAGGAAGANGSVTGIAGTNPAAATGAAPATSGSNRLAILAGVGGLAAVALITLFALRPGRRDPEVTVAQGAPPPIASVAPAAPEPTPSAAPAVSAAAAAPTASAESSGSRASKPDKPKPSVAAAPAAAAAAPVARPAKPAAPTGENVPAIRNPGF